MWRLLITAGIHTLSWLSVVLYQYLCLITCPNFYLISSKEMKNKPYRLSYWITDGQISISASNLNVHSRCFVV